MEPNILIINKDFNADELLNYIIYFKEVNPTIDFRILNNIELNFNIDNVSYSENYKNILPEEIENFIYSQVYILSGNKVILEKELYYTIFNNKLSAIYWITKSRRYKRVLYAPFNDKKANSIVVFPGPMVPLSLGSHQRVFSSVLLLNLNGIYTDVLITAGNDKDNKILEDLLKAIAPNVYVYKNTKRKYPFFIRYRALLEKFIYKKMGLAHLLSDTFIERNFIKPTISARKTLKKIVNTNNYTNITITYAWMIDVVNDLDNIDKYNLICDTFDVQYVRNKTQNKGLFRLFLMEKYQKRLELNQLNRMNKILAISKEDYRYFRKEKLIKKKVILLNPSFEYTYNLVQKENLLNAFRFGFIGTKMLANLKSLEYVLDNLWPKIIELNPDAKLFIAGSICNELVIQKKAEFDDSIELLGYVQSLKLFYKNIDILISPVIVKGGINFKNVEVIMAGKYLLTNKLGISPISDNLLSFNEVNEYVDFLKKVQNIEYFYNLKISNQTEILELFSDKAFLKTFKQKVLC